MRSDAIKWKAIDTSATTSALIKTPTPFVTAKGLAVIAAIVSVPKCNKCPAACCRWIVDLSPAEAARIPENLIQRDGSAAAMNRNPVTRYCVALDLKSFTCSIYDQRPHACRNFPMGGTSCVTARAMMSPQQLRQAL